MRKPMYHPYDVVCTIGWELDGTKGPMLSMGIDILCSSHRTNFAGSSHAMRYLWEKSSISHLI